jgi:hypothetical protein
VVFILSSVLGPVLGGVINGHDHSSWRWVFLLKYRAVPCLRAEYEADRNTAHQQEP